ncbi:hypothetical protein GOODEAATRI_008665, partial [Goodea atripinnis]
NLLLPRPRVSFWARFIAAALKEQICNYPASNLSLLICHKPRDPIGPLCPRSTVTSSALNSCLCNVHCAELEPILWTTSGHRGGLFLSVCHVIVCM